MGNIFKKAAQKVKKAVSKAGKVAKRATAAVVTGGLSEIPGTKKLVAGVSKTASTLLAPTSVGDLFHSANLLAGPAAATLLGPAALPLVGPTVLPTLQPTGVQGTMGLENILGGLKGVLSTVGGFGGTTGQIAQVGSSFLSGFLPAQGPIRTAQPFMDTGMMTPVAALSPAVATSAMTAVAQILMKMSAFLGKKMTLTSAMRVIRNLSNMLASPAAIGAAIGLSLGEIGALITASSMKKHRRMNPGNAKALRRAHRRVESFHRLCMTNDKLRTRRRSPSRGSRIINVKGGVCS